MALAFTRCSRSSKPCRRSILCRLIFSKLVKRVGLAERSIIGLFKRLPLVIAWRVALSGKLKSKVSTAFKLFALYRADTTVIVRTDRPIRIIFKRNAYHGAIIHLRRFGCKGHG